MRNMTKTTKAIIIGFQFSFNPLALQHFLWVRYRNVAIPKKINASVVKSHVNFPMLNAVDTPVRPSKTRTTGPKQQSEAIIPAIPPAYNSFLSSFFIFDAPLPLDICDHRNHKKHNNFFSPKWSYYILHTYRILDKNESEFPWVVCVHILDMSHFQLTFLYYYNNQSFLVLNFQLLL